MDADAEAIAADPGEELILDGNAVAGLLYDVFSAEMTASPTECAHCGNASDVGGLLAFNRVEGVVLRCPTCKDVMLRFVMAPDAVYLDARGAAYLRIAR